MVQNCNKNRPKHNITDLKIRFFFLKVTSKGNLKRSRYKWRHEKEGRTENVQE